MKFVLEINMGNEAMSRRGHLANAIREVANKVLNSRDFFCVEGTEHAIMDLNGNKVGHWKLVDE